MATDTAGGAAAATEMDVVPQARGTKFNYVVTAQKPTAVQASLVCSFTGPNELNLIVSKITRLEIHRVGPTGLQPVLDVPIYGRIATMEVFRPPGASQDLLFLCTEMRSKFCVLEYDAESGEIITRSNGDAQDRVGKEVINGQLGQIDPGSRVIALHLYEGMLKVIPVAADGRLGEVFNIRLEELQILDIKFLHDRPYPTIVLLHQDSKANRHVKTYEIRVAEKELVDGPFSHETVEASATILIPLPQGGCLVVGECLIAHCPVDGSISSIPLGPAPTHFKAYAMVDEDGARWLLGDHVGRLWLLRHHARRADSGAGRLPWELIQMGQTSIAHCISYVDNGHVFIGSMFGDSQLVRLNAESRSVDILVSYNNLGPIVDFCVVDLERQGQGQIVTCSGGFRDGTLRVVRNGIGIDELTTVAMPGVKGLWNLRRSSGDAYDSYLVLTFVDQTNVLAVSGSSDDDAVQMGEVEVPGFNAAAQTLLAVNLLPDLIAQVCADGVRLVAASSFAQVASWHPPAGDVVNVAAATDSTLLLACGAKLVLLAVGADGSLTQVSTCELPNEVACLDVAEGGVPLAAVGTWTNISVHLLRLPDLSVVYSESLGTETIPRSVLFAAFEGTPYLLCGLGDGQLYTYGIDASLPALHSRKKVTLGTQPVTFRRFRSRDTSHVFAASDRPTVIYSSSHKLLYSNVNLRDITCMCAFNSEAFPDGLALADDADLRVGTIDEIQKLHIRTVPLGEMPRRLAHQEASRTLLVLTCNFEVAVGGEEIEKHYLRLFDDTSFELLDSVALQPYENGCHVVSCTFTDDPTRYYVVGTAFAHPNEEEPSRGRMLVYSVHPDSRKLVEVSKAEIKGAAYRLAAFQGKLVACINSKVALFKWNADSESGSSAELVQECSHHGLILALFVQTRGDFIIVGDLMKSIHLLVYKPNEGVIVELARDFNPAWMMALDVLDDDLFIGAENGLNLFVAQRNADAASDEERSRLEIVGEYGLGEFVNAFRHGSLVMRLPEGDESGHVIPTLLFGTVNGVIGVIASLSEQQFNFLANVQKQLVTVVKGVGGFSHADWRSFSNQRKTVEAHHFLDGDLIESYLDLPREKQEIVARGMGGTSVEALTKVIEDMARLH